MDEKRRAGDTDRERESEFASEGKKRTLNSELRTED
jgi:hypothetical protein